jgi:hypothetical protein
MASKRKTLARVRKALTKYVRGNPTFDISVRRRRLGPSGRTGRFAEGRFHAFQVEASTAAEAVKIARRRVKDEGWGSIRGIVATKRNPPRVKGRKTKGGRAVTLKNFTGTVVKKSDGTVQIVGRGRRK